MIRFLFLFLVLALVFRILSIAIGTESKADFNACRDKGGTVFFCVTGLK